MYCHPSCAQQVRATCEVLPRGCAQYLIEIAGWSSRYIDMREVCGTLVRAALSGVRDA